jgi:hypothetical protein
VYLFGVYHSALHCSRADLTAQVRSAMQLAGHEGTLPAPPQSALKCIEQPICSKPLQSSPSKEIMQAEPNTETGKPRVTYFAGVALSGRPDYSPEQVAQGLCSWYLPIRPHTM